MAAFSWPFKSSISPFFSFLILSTSAIQALRSAWTTASSLTSLSWAVFQFVRVTKAVTISAPVTKLNTRITKTRILPRVVMVDPPGGAAKPFAAPADRKRTRPVRHRVYPKPADFPRNGRAGNMPSSPAAVNGNLRTWPRRHAPFFQLLEPGLEHRLPFLQQFQFGQR